MVKNAKKIISRTYQRSNQGTQSYGRGTTR